QRAVLRRTPGSCRTARPETWPEPWRILRQPRLAGLPRATKAVVAVDVHERRSQPSGHRSRTAAIPKAIRKQPKPTQIGLHARQLSFPRSARARCNLAYPEAAPSWSASLKAALPG